MTASEFKTKNNYRDYTARCCENCFYYILRTRHDGPETSTVGQCSANGDKNKLFYTLRTNVCDSWRNEAKQPGHNINPVDDTQHDI